LYVLDSTVRGCPGLPPPARSSRFSLGSTGVDWIQIGSSSAEPGPAQREWQSTRLALTVAIDNNFEQPISIFQNHPTGMAVQGACPHKHSGYGLTNLCYWVLHRGGDSSRDLKKPKRGGGWRPLLFQASLFQPAPPRKAALPKPGGVHLKVNATRLRFRSGETGGLFSPR